MDNAVQTWFQYVALLGPNYYSVPLRKDHNILLCFKISRSMCFRKSITVFLRCPTNVHNRLQGQGYREFRGPDHLLV